MRLPAQPRSVLRLVYGCERLPGMVINLAEYRIRRKQVLADSRTSTRSPPDSSTLLREDAGHHPDRVFEPNRVERAADWAYLVEPYARCVNDALFGRARVGAGILPLDIAFGSGYAANVAPAVEPR